MQLYIDIVQPDRFGAGGVVEAETDLGDIGQQDVGIGMSEVERLGVGSAVGAGVANLAVDHSDGIFKNRIIERIGAATAAADTGVIVSAPHGIWCGGVRYAVDQADRQTSKGDLGKCAPTTVAEVAAVAYVDLAQITAQIVVDKVSGAVGARGFQLAVGEASSIGDVQAEVGRDKIVVQVFVDMDDGGAGRALDGGEAKGEDGQSRIPFPVEYCHALFV